MPTLAARPRRALAAQAGVVAAGAGLLAALAVLGDSAHGLGANTAGQAIGFAVAGGLMCAAALAPRAGRPHGALALAAFGGFVALAGVSVAWSVEPSETWLATNNALFNLALFAAGVALAWLAPERWESLLGAVALAAVGLCAYGLASKVFPVSLSAQLEPARLSEPVGYWNAFGLLAAMGAVPLLWLATRRTGPAWLRIAAVPALGLLIAGLLLSISRGALVAAVIGVAIWLALAPRRLRSLAVILAASAAGGVVGLWAFGKDALTTDTGRLGDVPTAHEVGARVYYGHRLGLLLVVMVVVLAAAGWAIERLAPRVASFPVRRQAGRLAAGALGALALAGAVVLIASHGGPRQAVSDLGHGIGGDSAVVPANSPGRLGSVSSARSRYWKESREILADHPAEGAGFGAFAVARKPHREQRIEVAHAHGQLFEAAAGLGIGGLALALAFIGAWLMAAGRAVGLRRADLERAHTPERIGLTALFAVAITFGAHSLVDWTWSVPATAAIGLLCAGFVAGRGPFGSPRVQRRPAGGSRLVAGLAVVVALAALVSAWSPWRAQARTDEALQALADGDLGDARELARSARDANPLALEPILALAAVEQSSGNLAATRRVLHEGARIQPDNPRIWRAIGFFETDPRASIVAFRHAERLDPADPDNPFRVSAAQAAIDAGGAPR